jgi:uncharacterized protein YbjT (DUF2867 family)
MEATMFVIAGVTGHVGSVVAETLIAKGAKIKVIVRGAAKGAAWSKKGAEVAVGALEDAAFLTGALKGATGFFTLLPPSYTATDFFKTQRETADAIASAVKASGVPHVVLLSSIGADLETGTGPIRGLHYLEKVLGATGTKLTTIRAGSFQENAGQALGPAKSAGIFPNFGDSADYPIPMVATKDIAALAAAELVNGSGKSEVVDLVGPSYSYAQVADLLGKALGKELQVVNIPQPGWVPALVQAGFSQQIAELFAEMYAGFASGKVQPHGDRVVHGTTPLEATIAALTA